jgi:hypothetical protein
VQDPTVPAPTATVFQLTWPLAHACQRDRGLAAWAPTAPDALDATLRLTAAGDGERPPQAELVGAMLGSEADAAQLLDPPPREGHLFTKSEFFRQPLPSETITALVEHLAGGCLGASARGDRHAVGRRVQSRAH